MIDRTVYADGQSLNTLVRHYPAFFHEQNWYRAEPFAGKPHVGDFGPKQWPWPAAICAMAFLQLAKTGHFIWTDKYVFTSDTDAEGHRVYVGRAAQFGGLQIHRELKEDIR